MKMSFGNYLVVKESATFFAVYDCMYTSRKLITHKKNWRQATKLAKLLDDSFKVGYKEAKEEICHYI